MIPSQSQPSLPLDKFICREKPQEEAMPLDVLIVGAGPAGLSAAIRLAQLAKQDNKELEIGVIEKAASLGAHILSGAVINPMGFRKLFPDLKDEDFPFRGKVKGDRVYYLTNSGKIRLPTPPTMSNHGNFVGSLSEAVRWLGEKAESMGIGIYAGYPADSLLVDGNKVIGVRTTAMGVNRDGSQGDDYMPSMDILAKVTIVCEGTRGSLGQAYREWQNIKSENPQIFALGVKEIWETKRVPQNVIHTMGWPLPSDAFGGSFFYPMGDNLVSIGLVVGLDYHQPNLDVHELLQDMKQHPLFQYYLKDGEVVEWGAKTIPEGGYYSLPERFHGEGVLFAGDTIGLVNVPALKGIHHAMTSGILAAETTFDALAKEDYSVNVLKLYDEKIKASFIQKDLYETRNMRLAFKSGFYVGALKAVLMTLTKGAFPGGKISVATDAEEKKSAKPLAKSHAQGAGRLSKVDAVYRSGNKTRDDIPVHLIVGKDISKELAEFYCHVCPAGVYEWEGEHLVVNAPNCIDCKATDVLGPRWTPREGKAGPEYRHM